MRVADTIRLLAWHRMSESEIMAALKVEREYVRLVLSRGSNKFRRYRFDARLAASPQIPRCNSQD